MTLVRHLLQTAKAYATAQGLSLSRVSTIVFGDGKVLSRLDDGADLTTRRLETAMQWFSDNWPDGASWPEGPRRPDPSPAPLPETVS